MSICSQVEDHVLFVAELVVVAWFEESVDHRDDHRRREHSEIRLCVIGVKKF